MERLTKTCQDGTHRAADNLSCGENSWDYKALLLERLGIYEDTGLEPEEIKELVTGLRSMKAVVLTGTDAEEWMAYQDGKH